MRRDFSPTYAEYLYRYHPAPRDNKADDFGLFKGVGSALGFYILVGLLCLVVKWIF